MFEYRILKAADGCSVGVSTWARSKSQNWPAGLWPDPESFWQWKRLFPRIFLWKPISSVHTIQGLAGWFWLKVRFSLRREWCLASQFWQMESALRLWDRRLGRFLDSVLEIFNELCITAECKWNLFRLRLTKTSLKLDDWRSIGRTG